MLRHMNHSLSRRDFLVASTLGIAGAAWAATPEPAPALPAASAATPAVIDTHTHFYDPARTQGVPWPPRGDKLLFRTVLPESYRALPTPQKVTGTVVVEASPWVEDNQWLLDLAVREPFILGIVGNLPVGTPEFAGHLKRFAANPRFRGLRLRDRKLDGALDDQAFVADLKLLPAHNLSLDLVGGLEVLAFAQRLAPMLPDLRIVIDHLAGVRVDGQTPPAEWRRQVAALARNPRVFAKVSGLVEGTGRADGTAPRAVEFYRPVLDVVWEAFGPERLIYASNWPVSERFAPLATVQGIIGDYFASQGSAATAKVFSENARAAYRLPGGK
jgi:predicted TIM-barrel fold metal-dependent hydrolase